MNLLERILKFLARIHFWFREEEFDQLFGELILNSMPMPHAPLPMPMKVEENQMI
jgi:hypothetical protein